jgi:hypothetical protein
MMAGLNGLHQKQLPLWIFQKVRDSCHQKQAEKMSGNRKGTVDIARVVQQIQLIWKGEIHRIQCSLVQDR